MSYEFVRPQAYWDAKWKIALTNAQTEINRLRDISEHQSAMLALTLKEKNDLLHKPNPATLAAAKDSRYWETAYHGVSAQLRQSEETLRISQLDLRTTQENYRRLKNLASDFMEALKQ